MTTMAAITTSRGTEPPAAYEPTIPRAHSTKSIIAVVHSMRLAVYRGPKPYAGLFRAASLLMAKAATTLTSAPIRMTRAA